MPHVMNVMTALKCLSVHYLCIYEFESLGLWLCHVIFPSKSFLSDFIHFTETFSYDSWQRDREMLLSLVVIYQAFLDYHLRFNSILHSAAPFFITPLHADLKWRLDGQLSLLSFPRATMCLLSSWGNFGESYFKSDLEHYKFCTLHI